MGCYDTVMLPCPKCCAREVVQTKAGACLLRVYDLGDDIPADVIAGVASESPFTCADCGTQFELKVQAVGRILPFKNNDED